MDSFICSLILWSLSLSSLSQEQVGYRPSESFTFSMPEVTLSIKVFSGAAVVDLGAVWVTGSFWWKKDM
ncbi:hypothetical protein FGO68_gene2759 [Halteria grandinella]|uniref:Uncharacterized protein n=1 Tax=Halteria grandinella TaxID=5974 RepID=A0A8J8NF55_HALGN|nr:hypothetical protein FGO68_gene2759 [Halteria grandinella]